MICMVYLSASPPGNLHGPSCDSLRPAVSRICFRSGTSYLDCNQTKDYYTIIFPFVGLAFSNSDLKIFFTCFQYVPVYSILKLSKGAGTNIEKKIFFHQKRTIPVPILPCLLAKKLKSLAIDHLTKFLLTLVRSAGWM
jgi:hypothetical protein